MNDHERFPCEHGADAAVWVMHAHPDGAAAVADHVRRCPDCAETVLATEDTLAAVAATAAVPPPPALRTRILDAAASDLAPAPAPPAPRSRDSAPARRRPRLSRWATVAAAAVVVAGIAAGGVWVSQLEQARRSSTAGATGVSELLGLIVRSPHAVLVDSTGRPVAAVVLDGPRRSFYDLGLPPDPAGRPWVLWGLRGRDATAVATVDAAPTGTVREIPAGGDFEAYAITPQGSTPMAGRPEASGPVVPAA